MPTPHPDVHRPADDGPDRGCRDDGVANTSCTGAITSCLRRKRELEGTVQVPAFPSMTWPAPVVQSSRWRNEPPAEHKPPSSSQGRPSRNSPSSSRSSCSCSWKSSTWRERPTPSTHLRRRGPQRRPRGNRQPDLPRPRRARQVRRSGLDLSGPSDAGDHLPDRDRSPTRAPETCSGGLSGNYGIGWLAEVT